MVECIRRAWALLTFRLSPIMRKVMGSNGFRVMVVSVDSMASPDPKT